MSDLEGMGSRRNIIALGVNDRVETFRFAGREIIMREKDGEVFVQRVNRHKQPEGPSVKL